MRLAVADDRGAEEDGHLGVGVRGHDDLGGAELLRVVDDDGADGFGVERRLFVLDCLFCVVRPLGREQPKGCLGTTERRRNKNNSKAP